MTQAEVAEQVEALVDGTTLDNVLAALEEVCRLKAEHLRHAWQDHNTGRKWERTAEMLEKVRIRNMV